MGLSWAFRAAGCSSVLASLWKVDDAATAKLMEGFYRGLRVGLPKDVALRTAELALQRDPMASHPFFWASFQLSGDTSPLKIPALR